MLINIYRLTSVLDGGVATIVLFTNEYSHIRRAFLTSRVHVSGAERSGPTCRSVAQALSVASRSTLRSTLRPFFKGRSPLRSAPTNFLAAPLRSDANASIITSHHITSHSEDGCRPQWPLYPRNKYLYTTLLLTSI